MRILFSFFSLCLLFLSLSAKSDVVEESARYLSHDKLWGRKAGTLGNRQAREYLITQLHKLGVRPAGEEGFEQRFNKGSNLLGIILPKGMTSLSEKPRVLIGAHYDHVDHCKKTSLARSRICNGAADNAAAVAAILGAIKHIQENSQYPVAIALWDAEEKGLLGSRYFVKNPTFDLAGLKLYINLDIIGLNLFRGFEDHSFVLGAESGGIGLKQHVTEASRESGIKFHQLSYGLGHYRSDMTSFVLGGVEIPTVFFTDGDGKVYHSSADEFENLNLAKVQGISKTIGKLAVISSQEKEKYEFHPPLIRLSNRTIGGRLSGVFLGFRNGVVLPLYEDLDPLIELFHEVESLATLNAFSPKTLSQLPGKRERLISIRENGEIYFGKGEGIYVGRYVQYLLGLSRENSFIP